MGKKKRIKKKNQEKQWGGPDSDDDSQRNTSRDSDISSLRDHEDVFHQIIPSLLHLLWNHQVKITTSSANNAMDPNDFISRLPSDILYRIISFLPFESAVRTTFLSTRWKDLWKEALLDSVHDVTMEGAIAAISNFLNGFDKHHRHRPRNKWGFKFELSHGRAILIAISSNGALQLDFSAHNKQESPMPFDLLLELNLAWPRQMSPRYMFDWLLVKNRSFDSMRVKSLYLISVSYPFNEAVSSSLVPNFLFLESLTIAKCNGLRSLEIKHARGLRKLVVLDCPQLQSLGFEGSCLKSFLYRGNLVSFRFKLSSCRCYSCDLFCKCNSGLCLEDAMLDLRQGPLTQWSWEFEKPFLYRSYYGFYKSNHCSCDTKYKCFKSILRSIHAVESLTICRWFYETSMCKKLASSSRDPEFYFSKLKKLWWIDCSLERENINALLCFLKLCPNLERLYVTIDPKCYNLPSTGKFSAIVSAPEELKYLKVVKLEGFADEMEIFLARRLIPLFRENPVIISKSEGTCLKHLIKVAELEKRGKYPYKFKVVENVDEICPHHVHMNI